MGVIVLGVAILPLLGVGVVGLAEWWLIMRVRRTG